MKKISVQLVGFHSAEKAAAAIKDAAKQKVSAELEFNICDPEQLLDIASLEQGCDGIAVNVICDEKDPLGILNAQGDYISIYQADCNWRSGKLNRQLEFLQAHENCTLSMHDVELVKENGYPVDQDIRNRFIRTLGFEEYRYGIDRLQRFAYAGFFGTWMFRNIFRQEKERRLYETCGLNPRLTLITLLAVNGDCLNLYDDRLVYCQPDESQYQIIETHKYNAADVQEKLLELDNFQALLREHYGIETDPCYRRIHIANGAFNSFAETESTDESVQTLLALMGEIDRHECVDSTLETEEGNFFLYLQGKVLAYLTTKGSELDIPLLTYLDGIRDSDWAYSIRRCKSGAVQRAMIEKFTATDPEALAFLAADKQKNQLVRVLFRKVCRKLDKFCSRIKSVGTRLVLRQLRKKGYSEYMSREWYETVVNNLRNDKQTPLKQKLWCYRRGFMPWRIFQYEMTEENFKEYLSDRDYMYLHQINNSYKKWIEDKVTFRLVLEPFKQHLPEYYYQIIQRDDKQLLVKLPDCPEGYETTFDELFRLLREKGKLALKAASGTHGIGFYKMHYEDGKYYLNNKETTEYSIRKTIRSFKSYYVVTEYINMHDDIKKLFAGSVNTIRVMMINRDGHHPQLMDAYMRIGSERSGVTDNVAYGGVVCTVDLETGEFGNGMQIANHVFIDIENHPDSGEPLHGVIPNWEIIKEGLVEISQYMGQLEYLGFDVVCTPEGFVLLEVNSHQDLHRLRYYDQRVKDFFFYKLRRKERRYKIKRNY